LRDRESKASDWALVTGQAVCFLLTGTGKTLVQTGRGHKGGLNMKRHPEGTRGKGSLDKNE